MMNVMMFLIATASASPWSDARDADTAVAYSAFATNYPTHAKAAKARELAEQRAYSEAEVAQTEAAWLAYAAAFPKSPRATQARNNAGQRAWMDAATASSPVAIQSFLRRYPEHPNTQEALAKLDTLAAGEARTVDSETSWSRYLQKHPKGKYAEEASARRDELAYEAAKKAQTLSAMRDYLKRYPEGVYADEASEFVEGCLFDKVLPVIVLEGSWQDTNTYEAIHRDLKSRFDKSLKPKWQPYFSFLPTRVQTGMSTEDPRQLHRVDAHTAVMVIRYREEIGESFEPEGHATDIRSSMTIWSGTSPTPVVAHEVLATTPEVVRGQTLRSLYTEAVEAWAQNIGQVPAPKDLKL